MDEAEWVTIAAASLLFLVPIVAVIVVKYRQKKGLWRGGFQSFDDPNNPARQFNDPPPPSPDRANVRRRDE
ncbi:Secreted protein OS=Tsukamurella paurometabola (strain ATCC 8368 / DSM / CCUG 35730 / CIP 100753/ JCM 10117 / KCTC 9821 / NBRC 16120 / NCIMB 702349 / NCTC 13040) OX=521096 GN=Tpau_0826 PE=4 SV=1 [Tsukamurella paurometabola]|uniref:Uncharacterized protein n=1 Tax=Tsukamurella paurometabola (strain ATCC 8368 / DSM 20162 / CCUG 35730 / CIP 100753 / JCM 10117 / KCTC 9821 / NBRC 16120 / NCIMB 702349 / NCTC 13040) TaxID=521096 RepID=D5UTV8_TSUPD|nr:hypothetical protein [Tsukamurella paurometabola]ADG77462.1 hypothetical protein Tpau_0826 [Tsukamurella paurometabola DSM 20162]SUP27147.1 Uncharacterised protein [Tsukamurella paurometabola]